MARTLAPGEDVWSQTYVLGAANFTGAAHLAAVNGSAYASFSAFDGVELAVYDSGGWQAAAAVSSAGRTAGNAQLAQNNEHVALAWNEGTNGRIPGHSSCNGSPRPRFNSQPRGPDAGSHSCRTAG